jgi:para-nitrobenzyl esterase
MALTAPVGAPPGGKTVTIDAGMIEGEVSGDVLSFRGIPHAAPPGGISVMALLTSPEAKGLFHRAVVMLGGGRILVIGGRKLTGGTQAQPSADHLDIHFARSVGIQGIGPRALRALRVLPAEKVRGDLNM